MLIGHAKRFACAWLAAASVVAACNTQPAGESAGPSWKAFLASSTRAFDGRNIYVAHGDIAVSLDELRAEYARLFGEESALGVAAQPSTINRVNGRDDLWISYRALDLTYCVSNEFGGLKGRVISEMAEAARDWQGAGRVGFRYVPAEDAACTGGNTTVVFAVRPWSSGGACAFFPSGGGCVARTVVIDYSDLDSGAYGSVTTVGVLRHELGHVLGLRHEHIRAPGTNCTENTSWRAVTTYDSASVMHYPWCPESTNTGDLTLTERDASGIGTLYPAFRRELTAWDQPESGWTGYKQHVVDVSGDGRADLVWNQLETYNRTYVALSNSNGTFTRALTAWDQPETGWAGYNLHVVDVSGDGRADLVWNQLGTYNRTYVALSNGNGTFTRALTAWDQLETGWAGYKLHVVDVSGDGRADLVWNEVGTYNRTYVALSNGNGTFTRALTAWDQPETGWAEYKLHVVDVSGDGRADLVWNEVGTYNRTYVALSNGNGTFTRALTGWEQPETGWTGYTLHAVDISGDGRADLVWNQLGTYNRTYVALSNGNGTFTRALTAWDQPEAGWSRYTLYVVDVSGEGRADLVWNQLGTYNRTYVALSNGNGTFTRALTTWRQPETGWTGYTLHPVDVSGDGRADLVWNQLGTYNRSYTSLSLYPHFDISHDVASGPSVLQPQRPLRPESAAAAEYLEEDPNQGS